ncbi:MAG: S1C family serine protease [Pseudomonadota bacterium]
MGDTERVICADGPGRDNRMDEDYLPRIPGRTLPIVAAALAVVAVVAGVAALFLVYARAEQLDLEVQSLRREVHRLRGQGETLAGRVQSAESTLKRKDAGIAPLAGRVLKSVFTVETPTGFGSGFAAWVQDGKLVIVTADHVVEDVADGRVTISRKGGSWGGVIIARDPKHDLAAITIDANPAGAAPLWRRAARNRPRQGDELLLIGSPYGLEGTVTTGVVSRVTPRFIQTDAAANPGNSGGPAVDEKGRLVGVLVAGGGQNLNFAIPIGLACRKLRDC